MASVLQVDPNRREYELIATNRNSAEEDRMNSSTIVADIANNNNLLLEEDRSQQQSETASLVNNVQSPNLQPASSTTNLLDEDEEDNLVPVANNSTENLFQLLFNVGLCLIGGCCVVGGHVIIFVLVLLFVKGNNSEEGGGGGEGGKIGIWTASNLLLLVGVLLCLSISCFRALSMRMAAIWRLIRSGLSRRRGASGGGEGGEETGDGEPDIVQESRRLLREQLLLRELVRIGFLPESEEQAMNQRHQHLSRRLQLAMEDRDFTAEDYDRLLELDQDASGTRGLTENQIQRLPQAKISSCSHELKQTLLQREKCPICLDKYVEENQVMTLPCLHRFHSDCISTWLKKKGNCPVCQTAISF